MVDKILNKEYVILNGNRFDENFGYSGDDYDSFIVEYEHLYSGINYVCYENGNLASYYNVKNGIKNGEMVSFFPNGQVKEMKHIDKNTLEGIQKEFYENGLIKLVEYRLLGRLMAFKKFDEQGNILEEKKAPLESDFTNFNKLDER